MWIIIVAVVIVSFVVFFSPVARTGGNDGPGYNYGSIGGKPITREELGAAAMSTQMEYFLQNGQWPLRDPAARQRGFDPDAAAYERLLMLSKARELGLAVKPETVAQVAGEIMRNFGVASASELQQRVLGRDASLADFGTCIEQFLLQQQLMLAVGLPGSLVTTQTVTTLWKRENQEIAADLVVVPASNYVDSVTVTPEALQTHFTSVNERYRVPARVAVNYLEFPVTNYWPVGSQIFTNTITNVTEFAAAVYAEGGSNKFGGKALADATEQIVNETVRNFARRAATTNAQALHFEITDADSVAPDALSKAAARAGLTLKTSPPFDNQSFMPFLPREVIQKAFTLNPEHPVGEPVITENIVYLIGLATNIPSYLPGLEAVSNRVHFDYVQMTANQMANTAGEAVHQKLAEGLAKGEKFPAVCAAADVRPVPLSPFSRTTRSLPEVPPQVPLGAVQEAAFKLGPGQLSPYVPGAAGGFVVYVKELLPLDGKRLETELPEVLKQVRQNSMNEAYAVWFRQLIAAGGLRDTPYNRPQPPSVGPRASR
jgi:hypothetical protein